MESSRTRILILCLAMSIWVLLTRARALNVMASLDVTRPCHRNLDNTAREFSSGAIFEIVGAFLCHVNSIPDAPLFTQCFLIQGSNVTSGPHNKLVSNPKRTRSLEGVWPPSRFRS